MGNKKLAEVVGGNIARRRRQLNMTQEVLAEKVGIGQDSISRLEKGKISPKFDRLQDFADVLGCRAVDLFYIKNESVEEYGEVFMELIETLSPAAQKDVVELVDRIVRMLNKN